MKKGFTVFLLVVIALWLSTVFFTVDQADFAVVQRFGKVIRPRPGGDSIEPGLRMKMPWPIDSVVSVDKRRRVFLGRPDELITRDGHNVMLGSYVVWEVANEVRFVEKLPALIQTAEALLSSHVTGLVGGFISEIDLPAMVNTEPQSPPMQRISEGLVSQLRERTEAEYGIRVVDFRIRRLNYPDQNRMDIFDRMREERQVLINRYRTEGKRLADNIRSEAERDATITRARAREEAEVIRGSGEARAAQIYNLASERNPEFYRFLQELRTMEKIFDSKDTLVVPSDWFLSHLFYSGSGGAEE